MRIDRLDLLAFGPFTRVSLDFSGGAEGLHLVYGPNEAGKSSALRAIRQFFCGIPTRSTDDFVHKHAEMRVGALLRDRAGATLEIVRRKANKDTILGADGNAMDGADARLARWLGGVEPSEFLQKFVIDHAELVEGGKSVAEGKGDLGRLLFAAGSGLAGLGALQKRLEQEAEELFKRGGSKPAINAKLAELDTRRKRLRENTLRSSEWLEHDAALRVAHERSAALENELNETRRARGHLQRLHEALDPLARRASVLAALAVVADAPRLSDDFTERRRDAALRIAPNERIAADAETKVRELTETLDTLQVPAPLLERSDAIKALSPRLGSHRTEHSRRATLEAERVQLEAEIQGILRELGRDPLESLTPEALSALHLRATDRTAVLELANQRQALLQARNESRKALDTHNAKLQSVSARLAEHGPPRDPDSLRKALKRAQKAGDLDATIRQDRESLERTRAAGGRRLEGPGLLVRVARRAGGAGRCRRPKPSTSSRGISTPPARRPTTSPGASPNARPSSSGSTTTSRSYNSTAVSPPKTRWPPRRGTSARMPPGKPPETRLGRFRQVPRLRAVGSRPADDAADRLRREAKRVSDHARLVVDRARIAAALDELRPRQDSRPDLARRDRPPCAGRPSGSLSAWPSPGPPRARCKPGPAKAADLAALAARDPRSGRPPRLHRRDWKNSSAAPPPASCPTPSPPGRPGGRAGRAPGRPDRPRPGGDRRPRQGAQGPRASERRPRRPQGRSARN